VEVMQIKLDTVNQDEATKNREIIKFLVESQ